MLDISVVIIHYRMKEVLFKCLNSIFAQDFSCKYEVLVVDKDSGDGCLETVNNDFPAVRVISHSEFGISHSRNIGIKEARGRHILMLDADTIVQPGSLDCLVDFMDAHSDAAVVGGKLINADGTFQHSCRNFSSPLIALMQRNSVARKVFPKGQKIIDDYLFNDWDHNSVREVDYVIGACMLLRREALDAVGLLDERFFFGAEDEDWCYRAKKENWKVYYLPDALIIHDYRRKSANGINKMAFEHLKSGVYMYAKRYLTMR